MVSSTNLDPFWKPITKYRFLPHYTTFFYKSIWLPLDEWNVTCTKHILNGICLSSTMPTFEMLKC